MVGLLALGAAVLAACGDDDAATGADGDRPQVAVTTSILGDVITNLVGEQVDVVTIMPPGASPHDFQVSAQEANTVREADALIVNGGGFEAGLIDLIESAQGDGVPTFEAFSAVAALEGSDAHGHEEAADEDGDHDVTEHDEHGEHDDEGSAHDHGDEDPHFFTDPLRMAQAAEGVVEFLVETIDGVDADALQKTADNYIAELEALDAELRTILDAVPAERRVLITNHEVFGYFADRYGFEVAGAVLPSGSTADGASGGDMVELAALIDDEGVNAIFIDSSSPDDHAQALADEVGDVEVVELFTESLGGDGSGGETYAAMMRTNAERIADALGS